MDVWRKRHHFPRIQVKEESMKGSTQIGQLPDAFTGIEKAQVSSRIIGKAKGYEASVRVPVSDFALQATGPALRL